MQYFLGIDIGGSKTECALGDNVRVLARAREKSAKLGRVSQSEAKAALAAVIRRVCKSGKIDPHSIARTCAGSAGASLPELEADITRLLRELVGGQVCVVADIDIAHRAAFAGGPGVVVISGTGSIAYGVNQRGEKARAGGWGPPISDEGSGDWIGRQVVSDALLTQDSAAHSALRERLFQSWHISTPAQLAFLANASPPPDFAALLPDIIAAEKAGDLLARDVLIRAGHELSQLAMIVIRRLWRPEEAVSVVISGGVLEHCEFVREVFTHIMTNLRRGLMLLRATRKPAEGALMMAREAQQAAARPAQS